jgi:drug/metabolite transporter (DMT)-like permease
MSGELIALLTVICWSIGIFPFTEAAKRLGTATLNQYRLLLAWFILSLILLIFYPLNPITLFQKPGQVEYLFLGLSGIIGFTIGDYFSFSSFKMLGPKLGSLYTTFAPGAALIVGYFVLGESMNGWGVIGIAVTLGGVIWLTLSTKDKKASTDAGFERSNLGVVYGIVGAFCQGTGLVLSKVALNFEGGTQLVMMHAVWIRLLFAFAAAFILSLFTKRFIQNSKTILKNQENGLPYLFVGTLFGPVAGVTLSLLAIQRMPVAAAQTIFALLPMVVLPINYFYYKEKITIQAVMACLVAFLGVVILIYRDNLTWI